MNLPELPKLIVNGCGPYKYVFTYKNHWDKTIKSSVRRKGDTQSVGKFIPDEEKAGFGEILFNDEFKEKFPELEHWRVFRHKGGRLEFRPVDADVRITVKPQEIVKLHGGATWALNQIVGNTPLARALRTVFPEYKRYLHILSLVYFLVINNDRSLCNYEEFAECTWLPAGRGLTSGSLSRLLSKINKNRICKFLEILEKEYAKDRGGEIVERRFWALDSTSITSYSENIASVEYGHNKDLIAAPQTNMLAVVDQQTGVPVYYRSFDGNVPDVLTVRNTLAELAMMHLDTSNVILVTDRGYGSAANFEDMLRNKVSFICNTRRNLNKTITDLIREKYATLLDWNNYIDFIKQNAVTVNIQWKYDEFPVKGKRRRNNASATIYVHLYHSPEVFNEMALRLRSGLTVAMKQRRSNPEKLTQEQKKLLEAHTVTTKDGEPIISMHKVDETLRFAGVRVLISDTVDDALECAVAYEERNQVEYAFNTLKARLNCNRTGVHSTRNWEGKLFVQMLAVSVSGMVRARIKLYNKHVKADKANKANEAAYCVHYDSDHKLLAKLNNIFLTRFSGGFMFDEIAGKKKELFKILNVPVPTVEQCVPAETTEEEPDELAGENLAEDLMADSGTANPGMEDL